MTAVVGLVAVLSSGCVAIKQQIALQSRLPGFVTLRIDVCTSDRNNDTYFSCNPTIRGGSAGTAEPDNGFDGDANGAGRGQLLVGYRVPDGTVAPGTFTSTDGQLVLTRRDDYTAELTKTFPPSPGFRWEGYASGETPFDPDKPTDLTTTLQPEFALPAGPNGAPFTGPFRWRAVVGFRNTASVSPKATLDCVTIGTNCFDSPSTGVAATSITSAVSDLGVLAGDAVTVAPGATASVGYRVQNLDANNRGARTVGLSASTTVPGGSVAPATGTLAVPSNATPSTTVDVSVPAGTAPGTYAVSLTATANAGTGPALTRTSTVPVVVVDRTAPSIRISTPAEGATFVTGSAVAADFGCTDESNGSGVASCSGPVASGAAIDTTTAGEKTFTVTGTDAAGNAATLTQRYRVVAPQAVPAPPPGRVVVTIAFDAPKGAGPKATTFTLLQVKGAPSGSTLEATCSGKGCPKAKGSKLRLTKRNPGRVFSLKPWLRKPLRAGTVLKVTVTKPGSIGMVKNFAVRASKRPKITETCLTPGSKTARTSCST